MRHSLLSRSAVAVASLAVGSAALAATPANAVSSSGVTREQVLTAVNGVRAAVATDSSYSKATTRAISAIVIKVCDVDISAGEYFYQQSPRTDVVPATAGDDADGLRISARLVDPVNNNNTSCDFAAFASTAPGFQLSGTATVTGQRSTDGNTSPYQQVSNLSGDAFTTPAIIIDSAREGRLDNVVASATGNATKTSTVTTSKKVKDKKSKSEKKAAKKKYAKRLAQAEKNYDKALDKAGSSKSKKAAAKRVYAKARALAKAKYKYATAGYKIVKKKSTVTDVRPFSITTPAPAPSGPQIG
jgi:hypothetical protein